MDPPGLARGLPGPADDLGTGLETGGRDDCHPGAELRAGHEQAVRHVIAIPDVTERKPPLGTETLADRQVIRERLAGWRRSDRPLMTGTEAWRARSSTVACAFVRAMIASV